MADVQARECIACMGLGSDGASIRDEVAMYGSFPKQGDPQFRHQITKILIMAASKKVPLIGKPPYQLLKTSQTWVAPSVGGKNSLTALCERHDAWQEEPQSPFKSHECLGFPGKPFCLGTPKRFP